MSEPADNIADQFFPGLVGVLTILEPFLTDVVLVGGWVPYLMSLQKRDGMSGSPLMTRDIDIAVPRRLAAGGDVMDRLLREAGLRHEYRSADNPPVISFVGTLGGCEVEIEFLTEEPGGREQVLGQYRAHPHRDTGRLRVVGSRANAGCVCVQQKPDLRSEEDPLEEGEGSLLPIWCPRELVGFAC